jgi:hypothetical protein
MARPTTKTELTTAAADGWGKLQKAITAMPDKYASFAYADGFVESQKEVHWARDKNLRDVLIHLYEWHCLLLEWVAANREGDEKPFLPPPYNWKTYGDMNLGFWEKHQSTTLDTAETLLGESHSKVLALIEEFTNDELFTKGSFKWTGGSTLGSYCVSATSSHYDWAMKKLKKLL